MNTTNIHWYGQSAFRIEDEHKQIYFDPWKMPKGLPKADIIFVTHSHFDHYSQEDIDKLSHQGTIIVAPSDVAIKNDKRAKAVAPGDKFEIYGLNVWVVPAYNVNKSFHPRSKRWVGYVIELSEGTKIYHAGDSDRIPEMASIKADVVLLPIDGTYTMTAAEAAEVVNAINPKVAIPIHYGAIVGSDKDAEEFKKLVKVEVEIKKQEK
jgi:L-ascorbate metabolism protein UlaG (beta-lactamase superfamily)